MPRKPHPWRKLDYNIMTGTDAEKTATKADILAQINPIESAVMDEWAKDLESRILGVDPNAEART